MSKKITLEKVSTIFWLTAKNISILNLLDKNHHSFFCVINHYKRAHCKKFSIRRLSVPHNFHRHAARSFFWTFHKKKKYFKYAPYSVEFWRIRS
ncbi:hypothetical protein KM92DES2_11059 [uncultured Desulfovibrio sp.]|uniref:Uncharacterized protein n=1 Tax=uncultured Desulfovibrio sp. TaxID=167968 RepID=A0A212JG88_9BACT|nr:hypothetical protein KM92DES2_11059 [uncultured Desulfovibrio sp.]